MGVYMRACVTEEAQDSEARRSGFCGYLTCFPAVCVCDLERVTQVASMSSVVDCKIAALILKDYMRSSR